MGCGIEIVKYLVFIFNLVFSLIGIALLVIGAVFHMNMDTMHEDHTAPLFLILVGVIVFVISFFGCVGAIKGNSCMLKTYATFLIILLIIQIAIGAYDFVALKDEKSIEKEVKENIQAMFDKYNATVSSKEDMDLLQQTLSCCGVNGPEDWINKVPNSCCKEDKDDSSIKKTCNALSDHLFKKGCTERGTQKMVSILRGIGYVLFATCVWELLGIFCAFSLINSIKNQYRRGVYA